MADLKVGTTIGGSPVWHQGNLALVPSGNAILYKGARIYSENDKPSANELQVVSRAGDTMSGVLYIETSTDYPLALKSSVSGPAYIRFSKGNTPQSYVGTDAAGDFKVAMTDTNGAWAFEGLKIAKSNGDVSLKGALVSTNTGNFDIKYGSIQFIRANSSKNVYIGAPGGTDLVLGYAQDGMTTTKIRMDSAVYNKTGGLLISDTGLIQRSAMDNPYYNQTEADARFIRLNVNTATNGYLLSKSSDTGSPDNLVMGYSGFFRHNAAGGFRDLTINVGHPSSSNGANARGITFDYGSTGYGMYTYAYDSAGTKLANQKIYTEADKPTPAEIGALAAGANAVSASKLQTARTISLTGGATGSVSFDGSANASLAVTITSHTHSDYVKKIGDIMSGNLTVPKVLLSATQGTEANSVARRDFVESTVTAAGTGVKDLTITLPAGAPATGYIPVMFRTNSTSDSFVFIDTLSDADYHPMNNCSFIGNVRASGQTDRGNYAVGRFTIYSYAERAIHSIHGPSEGVNGFVVYVETRAFPINVRVDVGTTVTAYATDVTYGTSVFKVNGQESGNTKTIVLANFDKGSGTYNGSSRVYDNGYNPTPEAVGALPVNGNAVTASRLQTARLIAGVPFDGTSNISISATNVGAVAKAGDTMSGNLTFSDTEEGVRFAAFNSGSGIYNGTGDGATQNATNIQIKSWQGIGISPTAGLPSGMTMGQNSIWINARNGDITTIGSVNSNSVVSNSFKVVGSNGLFSSTNGSQGIYIGADTRTIVGGGSVAAGTVVIRPRGTNEPISNTVFNNDGTITNSVAPTNAGHLTNKAYVDSAIATGDALQVSKTGDTMTGNLTAPKVLVSDTQGTESNALTRKDYVDTELSKKLNLTGDTMTGTLTLSSSTFGTVGVSTGATFSGMYGNTRVPHIVVADTSGSSYAPALAARYVHNAGWGGIYSLGVLNHNAQSPGSFCVHHINGGGGQTFLWQFNGSSGDFTAPGSIFTESAQNNNGHALTRKDYVDTQVATRAPTTHTHTVAAITDLKPQDTADTANTLALRDAFGGLNARLLRTTYGDELGMNGAIAFRANNSTDNSTRYCSNPVAVREWMRGAKTNWDMNWRAYIEHTDNPMTEYHIPGKTAVLTYLNAAGNYIVSNSNGIAIDVGVRLRIDAGGNLYATGGVHDMGQRVYSPNNPPPNSNSHNHTAAQANSNVVAGAQYAVGSYILAQKLTTSVNGYGDNVLGSSLIPASAGNRYWDGNHLPGTWKCMGYAADTGQEVDQRTTLFIRIS